MARRKIKVRELEDVRVSHISLVKRGANRIPFRIIKNDSGDNTMSIDLGKLFLRKKEAAVPQIVGIALEKNEYSEELLTQLAAIGFVGTIDNESETTTLIKTEDYVEDDVQGVKLQNGMVVMVTHLEKALSRGDANSFAEAVTVNAVMPSVRMASDVFVGKVWDITYDSMSKAETTAAVSTMFTEFQSYVLGVINAVPEPLFKMERIDVAATVVAGVEIGAGSGDDKVTDETVEKTEEESTAAADESTETVAKDDETTDESTDTETEADDKKAEVTKSEYMDEIKNQLALITKSLGGLVTLKDSVDNLSTRVDKAEASAAAATEAINGVTVETTNEDSIIKSEGVESQAGTFSSALAFDGFEQA